MSTNKQVIKEFQEMKPSMVFKKLDMSKFPKEVREKIKSDLSGISDDALDMQQGQPTFKKWIEMMADHYPAAFGLKVEKVPSLAPSVTPAATKDMTVELEAKIKDLETRSGVIKKMILKQPAKRDELKVRLKTVEKMIKKLSDDLKEAKKTQKKISRKKSLGGFLLGAISGIVAGQFIDLKMRKKSFSYGAGGTIEGNKKFKYSITYQTVTPESAEDGDYADSGYVIQDEVSELQDILKEAVNRYGINEPSSVGYKDGKRTVTAGCWWSSVTPDHDHDYFTKGIEKYYSLHINNIDGSELNQEETQFIQEKLDSGRKLDWDDEDKEWWKDGGTIHSSNEDGILMFKADTKGGKYSIEVREHTNQLGTSYRVMDFTNGNSRSYASYNNKEIAVQRILDSIIGSKKIDGINYKISLDNLYIGENLPVAEKMWDIYNSSEYREWFKKEIDSLPEDKKKAIAEELKNKAIKYVKDNGYQENDSTIGTFFQIFRKERLIADFLKSKGEPSIKENFNNDVLPPSGKYAEYLQSASSKFGITVDEARNKYGQYTIGQWEELLSESKFPKIQDDLTTHSGMSNGGGVDSENLAVDVSGIGNVYRGTSIQEAIAVAKEYMKKNKNFQVRIYDEKYGYQYNLNGNLRIDLSEDSNYYKDNKGVVWSVIKDFGDGNALLENKKNENKKVPIKELIIKYRLTNKYSNGGGVENKRKYLVALPSLPNDKGFNHRTVLVSATDENEARIVAKRLKPNDNIGDIKEVNYSNGGGLDDKKVDLFEHPELTPPDVQKILERYQQEFGDSRDYKDTENMLKEIEEVGYTFDYYLDNEPYGLRKIGVELNELEGFEDMKHGGEIYGKREGGDKISIYYKNPKGKHFYISSTNSSKTVKEAVDKYNEMLIGEKYPQTAFAENKRLNKFDEMSKGGGVGKLKKLRQSVIDKNIIDISKQKKSKYIWMAWDNIDYYNAGLKPNSITEESDEETAIDAAHGFVEDDFAFVTVVVDNRKGEIIGRTDGSDFGRNDDDDNDDEMKRGGGVNSDTPKVYIADLAAYNEGKLIGEWVDLSDFSSGEEVMEKISELMEKWSKEQGEEREEYAVHDMENFPKDLYGESMGEEDFQKVIEYWEAVSNSDYPKEVVEEFMALTNDDDFSNAISNMDSVYQGKYSDAADFARQLIDDVGMPSNPEQYLYVTDTDKRIVAGEQADNDLEDMSDDDVLDRADMKEEYEEREQKESDIDKLEEEIYGLDKEDDADEIEEKQSELDNLNDELAEMDTLDEILAKAKEKVHDEIYEEWHDGLDDPYRFLVKELGIYSEEDLMKANFVGFDYESFAKDLEQDYHIIEDGGEVYVFSI